MTRRGRPGRDRGSATLVAVLSAACFSLLAAQMARTSRSAVVSVNAALTHARLAAAADAGLAVAVEGLTSANPSARWDLGRGVRTVDVDGAVLHVTVEDERGKIPLNTLTSVQVRQMFQSAGAPAAALQSLVDAFLDFRDPGRARPGAPELASDRQGGFRAVEELAQVPGVTPALYAAISPSATVMPDAGAFEARTATPLALQVMQGDLSGPQAIERQREIGGEQTALSVDTSLQPIHRALTVRVDAEGPDGASVEKVTILELTGQNARPYVVRQQNAGYG